MASLPGVYHAEVQSQQGNSCGVSTMAKSGGYGNSILIQRDKIKQKLANPIKYNGRMLYKVPDFPQ